MFAAVDDYATSKGFIEFQFCTNHRNRFQCSIGFLNRNFHFCSFRSSDKFHGIVGCVARNIFGFARCLGYFYNKIIGLNLARLPRWAASCYAFDFNFIIFLLQQSSDSEETTAQTLIKRAFFYWRKKISVRVHFVGDCVDQHCKALIFIEFITQTVKIFVHCFFYFRTSFFLQLLVRFYHKVFFVFVFFLGFLGIKVSVECLPFQIFSPTLLSFRIIRSKIYFIGI